MAKDDRQALPGSVRKSFRVFVRRVVRVDDEPPDAGGAQVLHGMRDHWASADRQKRLGHIFGERTQPGSQSRAQNEGGINVFRRHAVFLFPPPGQNVSSRPEGAFAYRSEVVKCLLQRYPRRLQARAACCRRRSLRRRRPAVCGATAGPGSFLPAVYFFFPYSGSIFMSAVTTKPGIVVSRIQ